MDDSFEATFVVSVSPTEAWAAFRTEGDRFVLPGFESTGTPIEVEPERKLHVVKDDMPCAGTEIVVTLEADGSGTRITVVQSGFGPGFERMRDAMTVGWRHIVADLALALERGVRGTRHLRPWSSIGCAIRAVPAGLEVRAVADDGFARRCGIEAGDILVTLAGAPVLDAADLAVVMRVFGAGDKVDAAWVHGRELRTGTAVL